MKSIPPLRGLIISLITFLFLLQPSPGKAQWNEYRYTYLFPAAALIEDLDFYKTKLEKEHPNLYLYTTQPEFNRFFDSLRTSIVTPDNSVNFYNLITLLLTKIRDGHTRILPDPATTEDNNRNAAFLPLQVHWEDRRLFVVKVYSSSTALLPGTEIQVLNGVSVAFIYDIMMQRLARDGMNTTYPNWLLENSFPEYCSYHLGNPSSFSLATRKPDGTYDSIILNGLSKDSINYYRKTKYGEPLGEDLYHTGITLSADTTLHTAVLTIKDFDDDILFEKYHQHFKDIIPALFIQIADLHVDHLILDLRGTQGEEIENGAILLSYILSLPFEMVHSCFKVDKLTYRIPTARLEPVKGAATGFHQPKADHFKGSLYVLTNGGTFCTAAMVCSALKSQDRCTFIGEETGGNPQITAGGGEYCTLPNTKTKVLVPTVRFELRDKEKMTGRGLMPDYTIIPTTGDLLSKKDPVLDKAYELIKTKSGK